MATSSKNENSAAASATEEKHVHDEFCTTWRTDLKLCRGLCVIFDCKISTKRGSFKVHSAFLKARSPVLAQWLEEDPDGIDFRTFEHESINTVLEYIYTGEVQSMKITSACEVYEVAHMIQLPLLKKHCVRFMKTHVTVPLLPQVARLAHKRKEKKLMRKLEFFCAQKLLEVVKSPEWVEFLGTDSRLANDILLAALEINEVKD